MYGVLGPIAHHDVVVHQGPNSAATQREALDVSAVGKALIAAHRGINHRREAVHRRGDLPLVIVVRELAAQIRRVLEGDEFVERIGGLQNLDLATVDGTGDAQHIHRDRFTGGRLLGVPAVADDHGHEPAAWPRSTKRVAVHRRVVVGDGHQLRNAPGDRHVGVHDELPGDGGVLVKSLHRGSQRINRSVPLRLVRIGRGAKVLHSREVRKTEHVEQQVFFPERLILELTLEDQVALRAAVRVVEEALGQVRWQVREEGLALIQFRPHSGGQRGQSIFGV